MREHLGWVGFSLVILMAAASGCGDPCLRACRHVFDDCGLSTASSEAACEQQCSQGAAEPSTCARPAAMQDCFSAASCDELKAGTAAVACQSACGS